MLSEQSRQSRMVQRRWRNVISNQGTLTPRLVCESASLHLLFQQPVGLSICPEVSFFKPSITNSCIKMYQHWCICTSSFCQSYQWVRQLHGEENFHHNMGLSLKGDQRQSISFSVLPNLGLSKHPLSRTTRRMLTNKQKTLGHEQLRTANSSNCQVYQSLDATGQLRCDPCRSPRCPK